jgi:hypothetical protein
MAFSCFPHPTLARGSTWLVIITHIGQKPSNVERKKILSVRNYWQLFSEIIGKTLLIVRNYWRNPTCSRVFTITYFNL